MGEWNPWGGERISKAWIEAIAILKDGEYHDFADLIPLMSEAGEILTKTAANMLHSAVLNNVLEKQGHYNSQTKRGRMVRFHQPVSTKWLIKPSRQQQIDRSYAELDPTEKRYDQGG